MGLHDGVFEAFEDHVDAISGVCSLNSKGENRHLHLGACSERQEVRPMFGLCLVVFGMLTVGTTGMVGTVGTVWDGQVGMVRLGWLGVVQSTMPIQPI